MFLAQKINSATQANKNTIMKSIIPALAALVTVCLLNGCDAVSRPSESEVRQAYLAEEPNRNITQIEFGNTITSQGGMLELAVGAPKDTKIFPTKVSYTDQSGKAWFVLCWVFKDSFGKLKCITAPC
jgi:Na+-translocating ferredoxin:NAD+ oxidoreductase RnfG subunit